MPRGDQSSCADKQKRKPQHIEADEDPGLVAARKGRVTRCKHAAA